MTCCNKAPQAGQLPATAVYAHTVWRPETGIWVSMGHTPSEASRGSFLPPQLLAVCQQLVATLGAKSPPSSPPSTRGRLPSGHVCLCPALPSGKDASRAAVGPSHVASFKLMMHREDPVSKGGHTLTWGLGLQHSTFRGTRSSHSHSPTAHVRNGSEAVFLLRQLPLCCVSWA